MSIVYTADVFCDFEHCGQWTNGLTENKPPRKWATRWVARSAGWVHYKGGDYCPDCWKKWKHLITDPDRDSL